jgi:hypothetical protein
MDPDPESTAIPIYAIRELRKFRHRLRWAASADAASLALHSLVEGHADLLPLAPDDVTGNARAVRFKEEIETPGDLVGVTNLERGPRNGHVAD